MKHKKYLLKSSVIFVISTSKNQQLPYRLLKNKPNFWVIIYLLYILVAVMHHLSAVFIISLSGSLTARWIRILQIVTFSAAQVDKIRV